MLCLLIPLGVSLGRIVGADPYVWPLPQDYTISSTLDLEISSSFKFVVSGNASNSAILSDVVNRYTSITFPHTVQNEVTTGISQLVINVASGNEDLQYGVDESYTLMVPNGTDSADSTTGVLRANTIYGAMRGLETFSQLVIYNFTLEYYQTSTCVINDSPRFGHRSILIDTARHFETVSSLKGLLDAMSYAKFNTLHWHMVDDQSFPYQSKTYPLLWNTAYSKYERFSQSDVMDIVQYAKYRGIRVIPEFDMPSHQAFGNYYPEICPPSCCSALNPVINGTYNASYAFLSGLFKEARGLFMDDWIHLGGDEPNLYCWTLNNSVTEWISQQNLTLNSAYEFFFSNVHKVAVNNQFSNVINWVEVFEYNNGTLDPNVAIIEVWQSKDVLASVVAGGFRGILADNDLWYLDSLGVTWDQMYTNEPFEGITNTTQQALIIGGETCMWGETVDPSDVEQTIWPRAAAVGERLWSAQSVNNVTSARPRIAYFRCLLNQRGIAAAPYNNTEARSAPLGPGSCYNQR